MRRCPWCEGKGYKMVYAEGKSLRRTCEYCWGDGDLSGKDMERVVIYFSGFGLVFIACAVLGSILTHILR